MQIKISTRHGSISDATREKISEKVERLSRLFERLTSIEVMIDMERHEEPVVDLKAVGIPVLTEKVDIAHARIEFASGAVANVTASRVSTERVRKMRFFQQREYLSLDYARRDAMRIRVRQPSPRPDFVFEKLPAKAEEPLHAELAAFLESVRTRRAARVDGAAGRRALELACRVMAGIQEHGRRVQVDAFSAPPITP